MQRRRFVAGSSWLLLTAAGAALGCEPDGDAHYRVRGQLRELTGEGEELRAVIHHERIAAFKARDGKASPMTSMTMAFSIAPGQDVRQLTPGTKLDFEFDVRWSRGSPLILTRFERLPDATELQLPEH